MMTKREYKYPPLPEGLTEAWEIAYWDSRVRRVLGYMKQKPTAAELAETKRRLELINSVIAVRKAVLTLNGKMYLVNVTQPVKAIGEGFLFDHLESLRQKKAK